MGAALAIALAGAAGAKELPRLPQDLLLPRSEESPGQVTFRHSSHVDEARPDCVGCHPRRFSILGRSRPTPRPKVTHAEMKQGEACGGCHGKQAFGFDDCTSCHAG
jgi:c(7)-type cytochrome triheme protein